MSERLTHYGWFMACPIYIGGVESQSPLIEQRWWVPEWWFWLNEYAFGTLCMIRSTLDPLFEPIYPILITGEISQK